MSRRSGRRRKNTSSRKKASGGLTRREFLILSSALTGAALLPAPQVRASDPGGDKVEHCLWLRSVRGRTSSNALEREVLSKETLKAARRQD